MLLEDFRRIIYIIKQIIYIIKLYLSILVLASNTKCCPILLLQKAKFSYTGHYDQLGKKNEA